LQQRQTIQKQIILETLDKLRDVKGHLSIDEIYSEINKDYASISKTTVYRNVRQLAEAGNIKKVYLEDGLERYDVNLDDHHHFTCRKCGMIFDAEIKGLLDFSQCLDDNYGFTTEAINLSFTGICASCRTLDNKQ